jgi:hypothetical protein
MTELVEHVSKKPVPAWSKNILIEVMCNDAEGEDVEVSEDARLSMRYHVTKHAWCRYLTAWFTSEMA